MSENQFDGSAIRDPWENISRFYETCTMCRSDGFTNSQIKLRLFWITLIGRAKDCLQCIPSDTINTWEESESLYLYEAFQRFKLLLRKCLNHSLENMEQMRCRYLPEA
jgi:hypothetical protein